MKAVSPAEFATLMDRLGPFEPAPRLAVAVSGGGDSLAATLLAAHWAHGHGGRVVGLTVDHGLRANSTAEAVMVGRWLANHGIEHHILAWLGDKPASDIQAQARQARYRLIEDWCRQAGILHVVLAHHQDDQAETFLLRLARGSGVEGLSGMAAIRHGPFLRWLRPCLDVPKARLQATLRHWDQDWVEDPSNQDPRHARVRWRNLLPVLAAEGVNAERLGQTAASLSLARDALEEQLAAAFVHHVQLDPAGYAWVDARAWGHWGDDLALRLLSRLLRSLGGEAVSPRLERTRSLLCRLRQGQGGTLSGCRVTVDGERVLFCREAGRMAAALPVLPGRDVVWDRRFRVRLPADAPSGLCLGPLGPQGWRRLTKLSGGTLPPCPALVRPTLPALFDQQGVCAVPHLGYKRDAGGWPQRPWLWPAPLRPLTEIAHCLV
ncbi:MAG: tRNA lysidine(34) synthetase TilS [Magnetospirillum gryphiswaldense]|nr:tRNA lysidine(34) synthetase TilS [Magnetospirillum gryphiswaldense]